MSDHLLDTAALSERAHSWCRPVGRGGRILDRTGPESEATRGVEPSYAAPLVDILTGGLLLGAEAPRVLAESTDRRPELKTGGKT